MILSKREEHLIKKYYVLASIRIPCLTAALMMPVLMIAAFIADFIAFDGESISVSGIFSILAGFMAGFAVFIYASLRIRTGMTSSEWLDITARAYEQNGSTPEFSGQLHGLKARLRHIAWIGNVKLPSVRGICTLVVLLPVFLTGGVCMPSFIRSYVSRTNRIEAVSASVRSIEEIFSGSGFEVRSPDRYDLNHSLNYVNIYMQNDTHDHVSLDLEDDGKISRISYSTDVKDLHDTKKNIEDLNAFTAWINSFLEQLPDSTRMSGVDEYFPVPAMLTEAYMLSAGKKDVLTSIEDNSLHISLRYSQQYSTEYYPPSFDYTVHTVRTY